MGLEHIIRSSLLNRDICLAVYLDLSSAFDRVHHIDLLSKLAGGGLRGNILALIRNYLLNRKAFVRVDVYSEPYMMEAGCPQGSPLLFNIMLGDLPLDDAVQVLSYADDITLVLTGKDNMALQTLMQTMQSYLSKVVDWLGGWVLPNCKPIKVKHAVVL